MSITLDEALARLDALTANGPATPAQLRALANEVSVYAPGSVTVLYSGKMPDGSGASSVVKAMAAQNSDLRIISNTKAAVFLNHLDFKIAVAAAFDCDLGDIGNPGTAANTFMEATDGLWGDLSARFAAETTGEVRAVIGKVDPDRIFEVRELPELLKKDASIVSHIEGVAISELKAGDNLSALKSVQAASFANIGYSGLKFGTIELPDGTVRPFASGVDDFLHQVTNQPSYLINHPEAYVRMDTQINNLDPSMKSGLVAMDKAGVLKTLGPIGLLLSLALATNSAAAAEAEGHRDEAIKIMELWAADASGAFVGETMGAFLATLALTVAAAAGTTISVPLAALIVLGATLVGGYLGGNGATALYEYLSADWLKSISVISDILGSLPDPLVKALRWAPKDPLVFDLDGDGLEITPLKNGVMFDADGDTVKNASAWIGADDGLLARDLDGNGVIDSGLELFGDNTLLANGKTAAHGFAALADLDLGSVVNGVMVGAGDGVIDARDACFAELRVWRDLNQDGVSQADELATLTEAGIAAIGLSNTATSKNYDGDATLTRTGGYTRADGSEGQAGNFLLAVNYFERAFAPVEVSEAAQALPDFKGTGWVRDLREAATLEPGLIDLVAQADEAPTRAGYKAAIGDLIKSWALASSYASAGKQALAAGYGLILSEPLDAQERGWMDVANDADYRMWNAA